MFLIDEQKESELNSEMKSTPSDDAVKIVEMTTKGLEYYTNLVDEKAAARFESIDSNFDKNLKTQMLASIF